MPAPSLPSLTPQRHKALRNQHPLYKRLSGEGVWVFLEELGLDASQCERFMEAFFRQMDHILSSMAALEDDPALTGQITGSPERCCAACAARIGRRLRPDAADSRAPLPPFGIGCPLSLRLAHETATAQPPLPAMPEAPSILCAALAADPAGGLHRFLAAVEEFAPQTGRNSS